MKKKKNKLGIRNEKATHSNTIVHITRCII